MNLSPVDRSKLTRFAWLSIAAALVTIGLKAGAYLLTGSVGLLSDALESLVNLVGAVMALTMLTIAERPADEEHPYGHSKAEYFSSGVEGSLIMVAAVGIAVAAVDRLLHPRVLEQIGLGLAISVAASLVNLGVALVLLRASKHFDSITLRANAQHLLTDVWTSAGVVAGVGAVALSGWQWLDPGVALLVAANIVWTGVRIVRESVLGLMDTAMVPEELAAVQAALQPTGSRPGGAHRGRHPPRGPQRHRADASRVARRPRVLGRREPGTHQQARDGAASEPLITRRFAPAPFRVGPPRRAGCGRSR